MNLSIHTQLVLAFLAGLVMTKLLPVIIVVGVAAVYLGIVHIPDNVKTTITNFIASIKSKFNL